MPIHDEPVSLEPLRSDAIRAVVEAAVADGNAVVSLAQWSKTLAAHRREGLAPQLKARVAEQHPALRYYEEAGSPHNAPDEGYVDGAFAVSFPRPR